MDLHSARVHALANVLPRGWVRAAVFDQVGEEPAVMLALAWAWALVGELFADKSPSLPFSNLGANLVTKGSTSL